MAMNGKNNKLFIEKDIVDQYLPVMDRFRFDIMKGTAPVVVGHYLADRGGNPLSVDLPRDLVAYMKSVINKAYYERQQKATVGRPLRELVSFIIPGEDWVNAERRVVKTGKDGRVWLAPNPTLYEVKKQLFPLIYNTLTCDAELLPIAEPIDVVVIFHKKNISKSCSITTSLDWVLEVIADFGIIESMNQVSRISASYSLGTSGVEVIIRRSTQ